VLSIGHIQAGTFGSPNVIPSEVLIRGTSRSYSPEVRDLLERRLGEVAAGIAQAGGCTVDYHYLRRYPPLINSAEQTALAVQAAALTVGAENVDADTPPITGAEDFAFMLEKKPAPISWSATAATMSRAAATTSTRRSTTSTTRS